MMLSTIVSSDVEDVVFNLWGGKEYFHSPERRGDITMINDSHWDDVISILSGAPFIGLKRVIFHISGQEDSIDSLTTAVKKKFHRFEEMGILFIDNQEDEDCQ
jgi:hypothetical protein